MTVPSDDLLRLRDELTQCDADLLGIVRKRADIVRTIAETKARDDLPAFDRGREAAHLHALTERAETMGLPRTLVRDLFGALFASSRAEQRDVLARSAPRFRIGIVGSTSGMGAFLERVFSRAGFEVDGMGLGHGATAEEVASRNDLVIVAVPIHLTVDVVRRIGPHVRDGACLADVTSLKRAPLEAMLASTNEGVSVVGTHPMFGPAGDDMDRQKVVLCQGRGEAWMAKIKQLFELFGAETVLATPEEHDAQMALIQVLVHGKTIVLGSVLERLGADLVRSRELASPIYRAELAMIGRLFSQDAGLYADILTSNPDAAKVCGAFAREAELLARAVEEGRRETIVERFREVSAYLADFAVWARGESNAILADLVRHG
jgi:chorismate mutase/prephenate dehydrogenase